MSSAAVVEWVRAALHEASTLWPTVRCCDVDFLEHAAAIGVSRAQLAEFGPDLVLAFACAEAAPAALRAFESGYISRIDPSLYRIDRSADFVDEVKQQLRERLLAPPNPRIRGYAATGALLSWVRVSAVRIGVDLKRHEPKRGEQILADCMLQEFNVEGPETARYRVVLEDSIRNAFHTLDARERNLIRLHYIDGLTVDRLGAMYDVHRATAARWIVAVRTRVFQDVERDVKATLNLSPSEFQSVLGLVRSYLEASLSGLFGSAASLQQD